MADDPKPPMRGTVAFLLTQIGSHAAEQYAQVLAERDLTPPLAGILRMLFVTPGLSQQQMADRLGTAPSRIVGYLDDLEARGWISRIRDAVDRRVNVLALTESGRAAFAELAALSRDHDDRITASLSPAEYAKLAELLGKLSDARGLTPGVHPGYRHLRN